MMKPALPAPVLSIVIPAYGEADQIAESLSVIHATVAEIGVDFEIVVIDDGSADATWDVLRRVAASMPELVCASLARNFGKEGAILAGLDIARGAAVVLMDCDLQHPPRLIPEMYRIWRDGGVKVVNAVKRDRGRESALSALGSRLFYGLFEKLTGTRLSGSADFKLLDREVVDIYCGLPERNRFFRGLVAWMGFPQAEVYFDVAQRAAGGSKWSVSRLIQTAINVIISFSSKPLHFVTGMGLIFFMIAAVFTVQTLYKKLTGEAVEGFTTVILLILFSSSVVMVSLGIIGQYLAQIYEEVKNRPRYIIKERALSGQLVPPPPLPPPPGENDPEDWWKVDGPERERVDAFGDPAE
jgi:polyisoprenyl-phosphate glycosyltransferase